MAAYYTVSMYPVQFSVDYPDRPLDRKSTLLRVFYVLPIWVVLAFMSGTTYAFGLEKVSLAAAQAGGLLIRPHNGRRAGRGRGESDFEFKLDQEG